MNGREALFALVLAITAVAHAVNATRAGAGVDFFHYWMVPHLFAAGAGTTVYGPDESPRMRALMIRSLGPNAPPDPYRDRAGSYWKEFQVTNTPLCYLLLTPFATRDFASGYFAFQYLSLAGFCGGMLCLARLCGLAWLEGIAITATSLLCFECTASDIRVGNLNRLLVGWLAGVAWLAATDGASWRSMLGGMLLGLAACFKPIVGLACLMLPAYRFACGDRRRTVHEGIGIVAGLALGVLTPMLAIDGRIWLAWLARVRSFDWLAHSRVSAGNVSFVEFLLEQGAPDITLPLLTLTAGAIGIALIMIHGSRSHTALGIENPSPTPAGLVAAIALGLLAYLLTSRLTWLHYYVLSLPALVFLAARLRSGRVRWAGVGAVAGALAIALKPLFEITGLHGDALAMALMGAGAWLVFALVLGEFVSMHAEHAK